ncbi:hypothetical protein [Nocardioides convexus]|uniref:hypothetical protein n=1 Tax=Nocardioides convexus TaxID=2712224 RepID=UPI003100F4D7
MQETADALGVTTGTVKSQTSVALTKPAHPARRRRAHHHRSGRTPCLSSPTCCTAPSTTSTSPAPTSTTSPPRAARCASAAGSAAPSPRRSCSARSAAASCSPTRSAEIPTARSRRPRRTPARRTTSGRRGRWTTTSPSAVARCVSPARPSTWRRPRSGSWRRPSRATTTRRATSSSGPTAARGRSRSRRACRPSTATSPRRGSPGSAAGATCWCCTCGTWRGTRSLARVDVPSPGTTPPSAGEILEPALLDGDAAYLQTHGGVSRRVVWGTGEVRTLPRPVMSVRSGVATGGDKLGLDVRGDGCRDRPGPPHGRGRPHPVDGVTGRPLVVRQHLGRVVRRAGGRGQAGAAGGACP